jgi:phage-related protein
MEVVSSERIKPLRWVGASRSSVKSFPRPVRSEVGQALYAAQKGETDPAAKPMKGLEAAAF